MQTPLSGFDGFKELFNINKWQIPDTTVWSQNTPSGVALQSFVQSLGQTFQKAMTGLPIPTLTHLQQQYVCEASDLYISLLNKAIGKEGVESGNQTLWPTDNRFKSIDWQDRGFFELNAALYHLNAKFALRMADAIDLSPKEKTMFRYAIEQWVDAFAPSNFLATNPEAQKKLLQTSGQSFAEGLQNMIADLERGRISQTDEKAFEVGKNVATTAGAVVYENAFFQLIQYSPQTEKVGSKPILFVPPCINKYYILDLQPENSLIAYTVSQGHTVFLVSWVNPQASEHAQTTWDDYVEYGVLQAIDVVRDISKQNTINTLGFCIGGTLLVCALGVLAARQEKKVSSLTLLTCFIDFSDPGTLGVFVDEPQVRSREEIFSDGGVVSGKDLGSAFSSLRPNDLIWNYVVNNYLKGEKPPAFDLLYWNADSTNLPGKFFSWYMRNCYLENNLIKPNCVNILGKQLNLTQLDVPSFVFAAKEDHIVPWGSAYQTTHLLKGPVEFVLGASGHIAGVINPVSKNKRSYWVNHQTDHGQIDQGKAAKSQEQWLENATEKPGSWWSHWTGWLQAHQGELKDAKPNLGNTQYKPIEPAPGRYVMVKL